MLYIAYFAVIVFGTLIISTVSVFGGSFTINFSHIVNFVDLYSLLIIILPCLIMLLLTKSFKSFFSSFSYPFSNKNRPAEKSSKCLVSLKSVVIISFSAAGVNFCGSLINFISRMDLTQDSAFPHLIGRFGISLIPIFYSLVLLLLLLPLFIAVKKQLIDAEAAEKTAKLKSKPQKIIVKSKA